MRRRIGEPDPPACEAVQEGSVSRRVSVRADAIGTKRIDGNQKDVRPLALLNRRRRGEEQNRDRQHDQMPEVHGRIVLRSGLRSDYGRSSQKNVSKLPVADLQQLGSRA